MNKNEKIGIGTLILISIVIIGALAFTKTITQQNSRNILEQKSTEGITTQKQEDYSLEGDMPYFYGKVIESNQSYIIVEPNEGETIRKTADKISIDLGEKNDAVYEVGTNIKVTHTGFIRETYPAQIDAINIEVKSAEEFEIRFYDKQPKSDTKVHKILDKSETQKYDYDIYAYEGSVNILINGKETSLRETLLNNKITMDEIIAKANNDLENEKIKGAMYRDGGSMVYEYDNYRIIKFHRLDGKRDVYIGTKDMNISDIND